MLRGFGFGFGFLLCGFGFGFLLRGFGFLLRGFGFGLLFCGFGFLFRGGFSLWIRCRLGFRQSQGHEFRRPSRLWRRLERGVGCLQVVLDGCFNCESRTASRNRFHQESIDLAPVDQIHEHLTVIATAGDDRDEALFRFTQMLS